MNRTTSRVIQTIIAIIGSLCLLISIIPLSASSDENIWLTAEDQQTEQSVISNASLQTWQDGNRLWIYLPVLQGTPYEAEAQIGDAVTVSSEITDPASLDGAGIHTVILFDPSSSIGAYNRDKMKQAAKEIIAHHNEGETFTLAVYDSQIHELAADSADYEALQSQIDGIESLEQESRTREAMYDAFFRYGGSSSIYQRFVILSDGEDRQEEGPSRDDIVELYAASGYPFYSIGSLPEGDSDALENLFAVSRACNSLCFLLDEQENMELIGSQISADAPGQVVLVPLPEEVRDGSVQQVKLTVQTGQGSTQFQLEETMPLIALSEPVNGLQPSEDGEPDMETVAAQEAGELQTLPAEHPDGTILDFLAQESVIPGLSWMIFCVIGLVIIVLIILALFLIRHKQKDTQFSGSSAAGKERIGRDMPFAERYDYPDFTRDRSTFAKNPSFGPVNEPQPLDRSAADPGFSVEEFLSEVLFSEPKEEGSAADSVAVAAVSQEDEDDKTVLIRREAAKKLTLTREGSEGSTLECMVRSRITIGRKQGCDICLSDDKSVSGLHCSIRLQDGQLYIKDENSSNGTYLNDLQLNDECPLQSGDLLEIGLTRFRIGIQ